MSRSEYFAGLVGVGLSFCFFAFDLITPLGVASGVPYVSVVALGLLNKSLRLIFLFAVLGVLLTMLGFLVSPEGGEWWQILLNRFAAIFAILVIAIFGYVFLSRQLQLEEQIRKQADTDELTGVASRRYLLAELEARLLEANRYQRPFSLFLIDVDHFKNINDQFGHQVGDSMLKMIADVCLRSIRKVDTFGRYGGEEFLVVCPNTGSSEAKLLAERMRQSVSEASLGGEHTALRVTISIGIASSEDWSESSYDLIGLADEAMYAAKGRGRNQVVVSSTADGAQIPSVDGTNLSRGL